jgi:hypothetical protein
LLIQTTQKRRFLFVGLRQQWRFHFVAMRPWRRHICSTSIGNRKAASLTFHSQGGDLSVTRDGVGYALKLPAFSTEKTEINLDLELAIGARITAQ